MSGIYERLAEIGFDRKFIREHVLPDWWDDSLASNGPSRLIAEMTIARHLGFSLQELENPSAELALPPVSDFRLKHSKGATPKEVQPAVVVGQRVAELVVQLKKDTVRYESLPSAGEARASILKNGGLVDLRSLVDFCWSAGIALIHMNPQSLPAGKKFQGMALFRNANPAIVLAYGSDRPPWLAFHLAHELGHFYYEHTLPGGVTLVDSEIDEIDNDEQEGKANLFATELLTGDPAFALSPERLKPPELKKMALDYQQRYQIDAGAVVLFWARSASQSFMSYRPWPLAQQVIDDLGLKSGAQQIIAEALLSHLDLEDMPESTERFLSCLSTQLV